MFEAVCHDQMTSNISTLASNIGMPVATAHRQVATLVDEGLLMKMPNGRFALGWKLLRLAEANDWDNQMAVLASPILNRLARDTCSVVQMGKLEDGMVTYLFKTGPKSNKLFTRVGSQQEAYCSSLGKVLLANLTQDALDQYLSCGTFFALTPATITEPTLLNEEIALVRSQGFAEDRGEIEVGLRCVGVPVKGHNGKVRFAISISRRYRAIVSNLPPPSHADLLKLRQAASELEALLGLDADALASQSTQGHVNLEEHQRIKLQAIACSK